MRGFASTGTAMPFPVMQIGSAAPLPDAILRVQAEPPGSGMHTDMGMGGMEMETQVSAGFDAWIQVRIQELSGIVAAAPHAMADLETALVRASKGVLGALPAILLTVAIVLLFRRFTMKYRAFGLEEPAAGRAHGALKLLGWDIADRIVAILLFPVMSRLFVAGWTTDIGLAATIGHALIRFYDIMLIGQIMLRPTRPAYRLIPVKSHNASRLLILFGLAIAPSVLGSTFVPMLLRFDMPLPSAQLCGLVTLALMLSFASLFLLRLDLSLRRLGHVHMRRLGIFIAWLAIVGIWTLWSLSILSMRFSIITALLSTIGIAVIIWSLDSTLTLEIKREPTDGMRSLRRGFRLLGLFALVLFAGRLWIGESGALMPLKSWPGAERALIYAGTILFTGYLIWELSSLWAAKTLGVGRSIDPFADEEEMIAPASRLATFFPMARVILGLLVGFLAVLVALSNLDVNIGPVLAGAGVFGLAFSFGSQALIRDILSGIFFLGDDAFRVGEYIDTGRLKGTVEHISLRSMRLRHQNGQIHTIPYGQLQAITNFSRDWTTVKFNLRIDRDIDIEKVRKTVKKIGQALLADPEYGKEFIQPLKLQGIADVLDNALVIRVKFTSRPARATLLQRQCLKRIYLSFKENHIPFASNAVTVRDDRPGAVPDATPGPDGLIPASLAGAAAQSRVPAPAALAPALARG